MSDTPSGAAEQAENIVVNFPHTDEEHKRRILAAVKSAADDAPYAWVIGYVDKAERLGITPELFATLIKAEVADREAKATEKLAQDRLDQQRAETVRKTEGARQREQQRIDDAAKSKAKDKSKTFAEIIKLPSDQHEAKLEALAKTLDEDVATLRAEFVEYCGIEIPKSSEWDDVEPWPSPSRP